MMNLENDDDDGHEHEHEQEKPYEGLRMKAHDHGSKHPYFLRAKAPRLLRFPVRGDHHHHHQDGGEFKKPSLVSSGVGAVEKERPVVVPSFHSNKIDRFDEFSEEEDLANCLVMLSSKSHVMCRDENQVREGVDKGMFQCKACKKVFNSHQALGGHRASHKKVKGCFASKIDDLNDDENINVEESSISTQEEVDTQLPATSEPTTSRKRTKMHECSVCRRVFSSGQALGGHKRCHWLTSSSDNAFIPNFHDLQYDHHQISQKPLFTKPHEHEHGHEHENEHDLDLNLNLPPTPHDDPKQNDDKDKSNNNKHDHASTRLCLQQWSNADHEPKMGEINGGEEEGCAMKLRKLSDLSDVNLDGGWLQMGIPSTSEMR